MASVFTPSHSSLDAIFAPQTTYIIPSYQRPYSWQALGKSDKNNQINQMWDDLWQFFQDNPGEKEYFLGSMVIIRGKGLRNFEVIDGQQRLTTILLLFAAMRCFLERRSEPEIQPFRNRATVTLGGLLFNSVGIGLVQEMKMKIQRAAAAYDFEQALLRAVECATTLPPPSTENDRKHQEVAERYFQNRDYFTERLQERFLTGGRFTIDDARRFDAFFTFLSVRVSLVLIETSDFETAYSVFEILNNRGLPLTSRDLLRNFLIKELAEAGAQDPAGDWLALESDYALTEDFIGRWVESTTASQQRYSAFNDLLNLYRDSFRDSATRKKAFLLHDALRDDLARYSLIVEPVQRVSDSQIRNKLRFFRWCGNERYSTDLILALFRHTRYDGRADEEVLDFLCAYQRWILHTLLAPRTRFASGAIYRAIRGFRDGRPTDARSALALTADEQARLVGYIGGERLDNETAKLLLAVFVCWEEEARPDVIEQHLHYGDATLEHVLPQEPAAGTNWLTDFTPEFRRDFTYRLGNLTLVTSKLNSKARNSDFAKKRLLYRNTRLGLTVRLGEIDVLTPEHIRRRHEEILAGIRAELRL